ncbi:MAG: hypothetical protein A2W99_08140 [Bacteroidetes bacterium GWF2_33_16]|nr:MAG: hypothetical protein A2X00_08485 [Bacteroidetes bacterium GWE2_32_14]OFY02258.1 MAG: hypothetical protein A2W99_08140 [Bacteroidetes bacterium GWF2_33_16]
MKIIAIEREIKDVDWSNKSDILEKEAHQVYEMYLLGYLREIYFTENNCAVLILECENIKKATELLNTLPLVEHHMIRFEIMQLNPYNGYDRIINKTTKD